MSAPAATLNGAMGGNMAVNVVPQAVLGFGNDR